MIPIDLSGKVALVTGVTDCESFAWYIAKALQGGGRQARPRLPSAHGGHRRNHPRARDRRRPAACCPTAPATSRSRRCSPATSATTPWTTSTRRPRPTTLRQARRLHHPGHDRADRQGVRRHRHPDPQHRLQRRRSRSRPWTRAAAAYLTALSISAYSLTGLVRAAAAVHGESARRGVGGRPDLPRRRARRAALRRRHVHGQGGPADRRQAAGRTTSAARTSAST